MDLLGSDSSSEEEAVSFKINENYARNYEKWRKKEERQKLIDRYGDADTSSSSSEEEEIRSTPQMDKDWLRAYAVVRFKQPRLYKKGEKFFNEEAKPVVKKKEKATTLKDHERKFLLEKGGIESDEDSKPAQPHGMSYYEEQEEIKKSFKDALADSDDDDSDESGSGLLTKKHKTQEEKQLEENEYLEWLKGEREELDDKEAEAELAPLKAYWNDPTLNEKERTLRDYILNNGYMDQEESDDSDDEDDGGPMLPDFQAEEEFLDKAEDYEHKYNFRHEEPGGDEIKSYPRVIETSVRTKDTRRAEKRQRKMERKKMLKEQRKEDIRLLQKLQKEEKNEKLGKLKQIAKNPELDYDLDADFDPEEHNKIMQKYFNDDYYGDVQDTGEKPKFDYDAAIDDDGDDWWQNRLKEADEDDGDDNGNDEENDTVVNSTQDQDDEEEYEDDQNFIMDADYDPSQDYKAEKKRKKKYGKALAKKLPIFDPTVKTFDEYMAEYLDDKIDTLPFTYRDVPSNDFGLSTEEILQAQEKELNSWVSVKKMSQYRSSQEEETDKRRFASRARLEEKKHKILPSLFTKPDESKSDGTQKKKKKKKNKKKNNSTDIVENSVAEDLQPAALKESTDNHTAKEEKSLDSSFSGLKVKRKRKNSGEIDAQNKKKKRLSETDDSHVSESVLNTDSNVAGAEKGKEKKGLKLTDQRLGHKTSVKKGLLAPGKREIFQVANVERVGSTSRDVNGDIGIKTHKKKQKIEFSTEGSRMGLTPKHNNKEPTLLKASLSDKQAVKTGVNKKTSQDIKAGKIVKKMQGQMSEERIEDNKQDQLKSGKCKTKGKKMKKKKVSISNFSSKAIDSGKSAKTLNSKELERKLSQVMSASRLSKFGLGPNAFKTNKKKKKKQKKKEPQMA